MGALLVALSPTRLASLVSGLPIEISPPIQAAMRAQDDYNVALQQTVSPLTAPLRWTPLTPQNSWVYFGEPETTPAYLVDVAGRVWLKGVVKDGSTGVDIFTVPIPAPTEQQRFAVVTDTGIGELLVTKKGYVQLSSGGIDSLSLCGLSYLP